MAVSEIAYTQILGVPVVIWGGITTLLMLLLTAAVGFLNAKGIHTIPFKYHKPCAFATIILAFCHAALVILSNTGL
jgi:hypothetical protein